MSGIVGICNLDGRPVDPALLRRMTDVMAYRGPDGAGQWIDGPIGLGHRMLHTTPESLQEQQPLADETGTLCLALDGRLDNRDDLRAALQAHGAKLRTDTDAEMVLRAYACWGEACLKKIVGDFAFSIWDGRHRQLFCARDPLGIKPFYYYTDGRTFLWGSELRPLFEDTTVRREPNEGMIGEYLASAITNKEETLYQDIFRLPPAHFLLVRAGQIRKECYWNLDSVGSIRYRTDEAYAEHFSELFKEAVQCRMRSYGPVGAHLSGGLDSSSVVGMVQSLYREGVVDSGFETFSLVFPGLDCDESTYIQEVVRMWGIKSNALCPKVMDVSYPKEQVDHHQDFPYYPNFVMFNSFMTLAREKGFRVLLTGLGGDDCLTGSLYKYADLLRECRMLDFIRQFRFASSRLHTASSPSLHLILRYGFWPILPHAAHRVVRWLRKRDRALAETTWVNPQFVRRINLCERLRKQEITDQRVSSFAQRHIYSQVTGGQSTHLREMLAQYAAGLGLEFRHPFYDRRFIEFALALPDDQRLRQDQTKFILRRSMRQILPQTIRQRLTKAEFSAIFVKAFQALGDERLFHSLISVPKGWINGAQIREMYLHMRQFYSRGDKAYTKLVWPLWMVFGIDFWFKAVFGEQAIASPRGYRIQ